MKGLKGQTEIPAYTSAWLKNLFSLQTILIECLWVVKIPQALQNSHGENNLISNVIKNKKKRAALKIEIHQQLQQHF